MVVAFVEIFRGFRCYFKDFSKWNDIFVASSIDAALQKKKLIEAIFLISILNINPKLI